MGRIRVFLSRLFGLSSGKKRDADLRVEINAHIAEAAEEFERQGVPIDKARRLAFAQFGGVTQTMEAHRERRRFRPFSGLGLDLRLSLRLLWRQPGFSVISIAMIALGNSGSWVKGRENPQFLAVRTTGNPAALARDLQQFVSSLSPWASLENVMTMEARVERTLARPRLYATLVSGFAVFAVFVALMGLFGGLSYSVAQRTREIGVRSALGATPGNIMSLVLRQGGVMVIAGLAIGLGTATWATRFLAGFLFGVQPTDAGTLVGVGVGLTVVALFACAIPAWRASRIGALEALRR